MPLRVQVRERKKDVFADRERAGGGLFGKPLPHPYKRFADLFRGVDRVDSVPLGNGRVVLRFALKLRHKLRGVRGVQPHSAALNRRADARNPVLRTEERRVGNWSSARTVPLTFYLPLD